MNFALCQWHTITMIIFSYCFLFWHPFGGASFTVYYYMQCTKQFFEMVPLHSCPASVLILDLVKGFGTFVLDQYNVYFFLIFIYPLNHTQQQTTKIEQLIGCVCIFFKSSNYPSRDLNLGLPAGNQLLYPLSFLSSSCFLLFTLIKCEPILRSSF